MTTAENTPAPATKRTQRWRGILSFVCLTISILCLIVGSLFVWVRATAYNPDGFVSAALNVQGQVDVQDAIVNYVENDVITQQRAEDAASKVVEQLPVSADRKAFLTGVLAASLRAQVGNIVQNALSTGAARNLISNVSERASEGVVALLRDEPGVFAFQDDAIVFNTEPLVKEARAAVNAKLGTMAKYLPAPLAAEGYPVYIIAEGSGVTAVQNAITLVDLMAWVLPLAFLILMILGLLLARERRSTAYRTMIAIAVAAVVVFIALRITRSIIAGLIAEPASEQVYNAIVDQIGQRLLAQTMWLALLAAVVAGILWLLGPDRLAKRSRSWIARRSKDLANGAQSGDGRVTTFAREYARHLEIAGIAVIALVLIIFTSLGTTAWVVGLVLAVLWFLALEFTRSAPWMTSLIGRLRGKGKAAA